MNKIKLTQDKFTLVDDEDFEYLNQFHWSFTGNNGYAGAMHKGKRIYMHRIILNVPKGFQADHVNHNKLDHRRSNLRVVTQSQNNMNRIVTNNKHGYKGVYFYDNKKYYKKKTDLETNPRSWVARLKINKKVIRLGTFFTKEDAAQSYNEAATKYFGKYAKLNQL